jgi:Adenylate and Guanylate cyclase catalytic domain
MQLTSIPQISSHIDSLYCVAARMESTGIPANIQLSQSTYDLLIAGGKLNWIVPREDLINVKGKGTLKTYWLKIGDLKTESFHEGSSNESVIVSDQSQAQSMDHVKRERLCNWMGELLSVHIKAMVM